jgi:hypothetical protein
MVSWSVDITQVQKQNRLLPGYVQEVKFIIAYL